MIARVHKSMQEKDKGFTLIELLVVIIIIGILAAIAIPVFLNQRKKAVDSGIKSDLRTIANELESFYVDNQTYEGAASGGADGTVTIVGQGSGTDDDLTITLSDPETEVDFVELGTNSFLVTAVNTEKGTGTTWQYDSDGGGLGEGEASDD